MYNIDTYMHIYPYITNDHIEQICIDNKYPKPLEDFKSVREW